jgi:ubiquinone/menaquinone biosynthesis C-methylase UbiE
MTHLATMSAVENPRHTPQMRRGSGACVIKNATQALVAHASSMRMAVQMITAEAGGRLSLFIAVWVTGCRAYCNIPSSWAILRAMARHRDGSRRYHDRVARQYDAIYDDPYWHFHDELTWQAIKPWLPRKMPASCADLGCGTGKWGLKLLKSGFDVHFIDHAAAMIEQVREKLPSMGPRAKRATLLAADIVEMPDVPSDTFELILAMGDPLSICSDARRAAREMARICRLGGVVIATADNKLAALDHYVERGNLDALEEFVKTGKTNWLTADDRERFELTTFTPASLKKLFEGAGFDVVSITGKTIIPVRDNKILFEKPGAMERLLAMEEELSRDPASAARAGHLQIIARRKTGDCATQALSTPTH